MRLHRLRLPNPVNNNVCLCIIPPLDFETPGAELRTWKTFKTLLYANNVAVYTKHFQLKVPVKTCVAYAFSHSLLNLDCIIPIC